MSESSVVEVWLPVKRYRLTIKHRILTELGEISHFILNVLHKYELPLQSIYDITGLNEHQLQPVIERLQGLKFINDDLQLTESGKLTAYALSHLHGKEIEVYMDQNYGSYSSSWFLALSNCESIQALPVSAIQVETPGNKKSNYTEDCFQQTQRFKKSLPEILPSLISDFQHFADLKNGKWGMEWDITLFSVEENQQHGICITLPLKRHDNAMQRNDNLKKPLRLYTRLLVLTTNCKQPTGFEWLDKRSLAPLVNVYSEHDNEVYNDIPLFYDSVDGTELVDGTLKDNSTFHEGKANKLLLHAIENEMFDPLLSIEHYFSLAWQLHEFSYSEVIENISFSNLIRID
ncbi:hypothetical protein [Rheinheimera maricola]|uniref:Uncharacterized protein n=1 Tax=Rheinheimera maricola TaxID=2793282 RepID=A0ABS7X7X8_9GAMM|nr:hypothetical protein [Rheinheimera maricola]MBZ9610843.1 hypothetical protein [Rheinheimera maricola]